MKYLLSVLRRDQPAGLCPVSTGHVNLWPLVVQPCRLLPSREHPSQLCLLSPRGVNLTVLSALSGHASSISHADLVSAETCVWGVGFRHLGQCGLPLPEQCLARVSKSSSAWGSTRAHLGRVLFDLAGEQVDPRGSHVGELRLESGRVPLHSQDRDLLVVVFHFAGPKSGLVLTYYGYSD